MPPVTPPTPHTQACSRCRNEKTRGFTLIELLTVIAIIGVLAAIILPVTAKVRQSARRTNCVSNLRQIGVGIANYIVDHKGKLPGPTYTSMTCLNNNQHLGQYIWGYMGNVTVDKNYRSASLACPAWYKASGQNSDARFFDIKGSYVVAEGTKNVTKQSFGDANSTTKPPGLWEQIPTPSRLRAISDTDQIIHPNGGSFSYCPEKPAHGGYRNVLFFDWHVVSMKAFETKTEWDDFWTEYSK